MVFYVNLNIGKIKYIFYLFLFSSPLRLKKRKKNVEKNAILKIKINIFKNKQKIYNFINEKTYVFLNCFSKVIHESYLPLFLKLSSKSLQIFSNFLRFIISQIPTFECPSSLNFLLSSSPAL